MSELKAFDVILGQYCEDDSPCVVAIDADQNPMILNEKVYLKSEADKVIAELKDKLSHKTEFAIQCQMAAHTLQQKLRHNKYKRCLAMARMCEERSARYDVLQEGHDLDWSREIEFYYKWYMRWLKLAKHFKPEAR